MSKGFTSLLPEDVWDEVSRFVGKVQASQPQKSKERQNQKFDLTCMNRNDSLPEGPKGQ